MWPTQTIVPSQIGAPKSEWTPSGGLSREDDRDPDPAAGERNHPYLQPG